MDTDTTPPPVFRNGKPDLRKKKQTLTTYRRNARAVLLAQERNTAPPPKFELLPAKRDEWLASLPVPECSPTIDDLSAAEDVQALVLAAVAEQDEDKSFAVADFLSRFSKNLAAAVGGVARGLRVDEWEHNAGMSYSRVNTLAKLDSKGFGVIWNEAWRVRKETQAMQVREKAVDRAVNGDDVPLVGRVERDRDGIIGSRKSYSDRMMEYLMEEVKPVQERVASKGGAGAPQVNVGQIVYNLPNLPTDVAARIVSPPAPAKTIDAQAATGS